MAPLLWPVNVALRRGERCQLPGAPRPFRGPDPSAAVLLDRL